MLLRLLILLLPLGLLPTQTLAQSLVGVTPDLMLVMPDGRHARLAALRRPDDTALMAQARTRLQNLLTADGVALSAESSLPTDRYGRAWVVARRGDENLAIRLVKDGLLLVDPLTGREDDLPALLAAEAEARNARRGLWGQANTPSLTPDATDQAIGRFALVTGTITATARKDDWIYLNFGKNWRDDFTLKISANDWPAFRRAKYNVKKLVGATVLARGLITHDNGPSITLLTPAALTIISPAAKDQPQ